MDFAFDRAHGLNSGPARFGLAGALRLSSALHVGTVIGLIVFGLLMHLGVIYFAGTAVITITLVYEHRLVSPDDSPRSTARSSTSTAGSASSSAPAPCWRRFT